MIYLNQDSTVAALRQQLADYERHEQTLRDNGIDGHTNAVARVLLAEADNAKMAAALRKAYAYLTQRPPNNRGWNALLNEIEAALPRVAQTERV